jgi:hypothetical protein
MIAPPKPTSHDELEALIKEARARQLRRRLLGAAGVAIASAAALSIYAFTLGNGGRTNLVSGSGRAIPPSCHASQLSATAALNGATGSMFGFATVRNTSLTACSLPATPPRVSIIWRGEQMPAQQKRFAGPGDVPIHVLAPGRAAFVHMHWAEWCGTPSAGTVIRPTFSLHFGAAVVAAQAQQMTPPRCDVPGTISTIFVGPAVASA